MEFFSEFSCFSKFWRSFIKSTINCRFLSILFNFCARSLIFQYQQFISRNKKNNNTKKNKRIYNASRISFGNHILLKLTYFDIITILAFLQIIKWKSSAWIKKKMKKRKKCCASKFILAIKIYSYLQKILRYTIQHIFQIPFSSKK